MNVGLSLQWQIPSQATMGLDRGYPQTLLFQQWAALVKQEVASEYVHEKKMYAEL